MRDRPREAVDAEPNMFDVMDQLDLEQWTVEELGGWDEIERMVAGARKVPTKERQPFEPQDP